MTIQEIKEYIDTSTQEYIDEKIDVYEFANRIYTVRDMLDELDEPKPKFEDIINSKLISYLTPEEVSNQITAGIENIQPNQTFSGDEVKVLLQELKNKVDRIIPISFNYDFTK